MKKMYIHYGTTNFDIDVFNMKKDKNLCPSLSKPSFGFWASNVDATFGWRDWVEEQYYDDDDKWLSAIKEQKFFMFKLKNDARVLYINHNDDINPYLAHIEKFNLSDSEKEHINYVKSHIDYDKIASEYDAIELCHDYDYSIHYGFFYTWDVDSIVILNPDIIIPATREDYQQRIVDMHKFLDDFNNHFGIDAVISANIDTLKISISIDSTVHEFSFVDSVHRIITELYGDENLDIYNKYIDYVIEWLHKQV